MRDNRNQPDLSKEIQGVVPATPAIQHLAEAKEVGEKMVFEAKNPENGAKDMLMEKVEDEHGAPRQIANVLGYMSGASNKRRSSMRDESASKSAAQEKTSSSKNRRSSDHKSRRKSFDPDDLSHRQYQKQRRHSGSKRTLDEDDVHLYANKKTKSSSNDVNPFENLLESAVKSSGSRANRESSESSSMKKRRSCDNRLPRVKDDIESSLTPHMSGSRTSGKHTSGSRSSSILPDILPDFEYSDEPTITPAIPASSKKRRSAPVLATSDDSNIASAPTSSMPTRVNSRRHSLGSHSAIAQAAQENRNPNLYPLPLSIGKEGSDNVVSKPNVSRRISMANVKNLLDNLDDNLRQQPTFGKSKKSPRAAVRSQGIHVLHGGEEEPMHLSNDNGLSSKKQNAWMDI